jgi:hypothetical protein
MIRHAVMTVAMLAVLASARPALADATPAASPSGGTTSSAGSNHPSVDPCALLTARDASSVIGAVNPTPRRPSPDECLWSAASLTNASGPVSQVLFTVDAAQQVKHGCHGLGCLSAVQSVTSMIPGASAFDNTLSTIGGTATMIQGLGQKAAWSNGILAVLQDQTIFKVQLSGTQSDLLDPSKQLAEKVLTNLQNSPATPQP